MNRITAETKQKWESAKFSDKVSRDTELQSKSKNDDTVLFYSYAQTRAKSEKSRERMLGDTSL